eukprot:TRINITY_DN31000_c0_g1_i1.p1 TRINITY_DN31000_c0_g1~~TRINITY_DN31000_c0_g1_i1.p1  ORF type:complete len:242 (+),score=48.72 TRINITY_DN31000_c0_g1_i1:33-758(+)
MPPRLASSAASKTDTCAKKKVPAASSGAKAKGDEQSKNVVNDFTVQRCTLEAIEAGIPQKNIKQWVIDLNRDFYVRDDASFIAAFSEKRAAHERKVAKQQRRASVRARNRHLEETDDIGQEDNLIRPPKISRRDNVSLNAIAALAREDVACEVCASYEQSLAIRLVLARGGSAAEAFSKLSKDSPHSNIVPGRGKLLQGDMVSLKQLAILIHPDKTTHPQAKEAFQILAPLISGGCRQTQL